MIGKLNWVRQHTRHDISFEVSNLSRSFQEGTEKDLERANKTVRKLKRDKQVLKLEKIEERGVRWEVYADASFGNARAGGSQIG